MLNLKAITVSKMTSHCAGTVQMREESERGIRDTAEFATKRIFSKYTIKNGSDRGLARGLYMSLKYTPEMSVNEHVMMSSDQRSSLCHPANL